MLSIFIHGQDVAVVISSHVLNYLAFGHKLCTALFGAWRKAFKYANATGTHRKPALVVNADDVVLHS